MDWRSFIKEQHYVDAKDEVGKWLLARVEKIKNDNTIYVKYDGWKKKYDRVLFLCKH